MRPQPSAPLLRLGATRGEIVAAIRAAAHANGCTCEPTIDLPPRPARRAGVTRVTVSHDDGCQLLQWIEAQP